MKALGVLMVLGSAGGWCLLRYQVGLLPLRLGRALLNDLAVFRYQIQTCRTPLPELLEVYLTDGIAAEALWHPLREMLSEEPCSLCQCWREAVDPLPISIRKTLEPLGPLLSTGDEPLARAIEETREELTRFLREETVRQAAQCRITAALCLAGACLVVLVLL